jgi:hypothetical protein
MGITQAALFSNQALLTRVLQYHVLNNVLANTGALAAAGTQATRLTGKSVALSGSTDSITVQAEVNSASVVLGAAINGPYGTSTVSAAQHSTAQHSLAAWSQWVLDACQHCMQASP